jgi:hypothetical protein
MDLTPLVAPVRNVRVSVIDGQSIQSIVRAAA